MTIVRTPGVTVRAGTDAEPGATRVLLWRSPSRIPDDIVEQLGDRRPTPGQRLTGLSRGLAWLVAGASAEQDRESSRSVGTMLLRDLPAEDHRLVHCHVPEGFSDQELTGLVEGLVVGGYSPRLLATEPPPVLSRVLLTDPAGRTELIEAAAVVAAAHCAARDLQNAPANLVTPTVLANRAREMAAANPHLTAKVLRGQEIGAAGLGAFAAVAQGAAEPAALIELRYEPPQATGPLTAWVGKCITFDSGGINLKRSGAAMAEMKFDMSGGAAVIEAVGAVAALGLPVRLLAVAGASENMPGQGAVHPGDIVTTLAGRTVEITNTDAEGRLVLADCLAWAARAGADRLVDLATLTGSVVTMFGGRYGALMSTDDALAEQVLSAGQDAGELVWRLPLHPWYGTRIRSDYADLANSRRDDGASTILAGTFLREFAGDLPWAHIDALSWDLDHEDGPSGGAAFGLRLLVQLACREAGLAVPTLCRPTRPSPTSDETPAPAERSTTT